MLAESVICKDWLKHTAAPASVLHEAESVVEAAARYLAAGGSARDFLAAVRVPLHPPPHGVALLQWEGFGVPKRNVLTDLLGWTPLNELTAALMAAAGDPSIKAVVIAIDAAGASMFAAPGLCAAIHAAAQEKPVVVWTDGALLGGAYWAASAASRIYLSGPTVSVGGIAIGLEHRHVIQPREGVAASEVVAGRFKRVASSLRPLDDAGRADLQARADYLYGLFVESVAQGRGVPAWHVHEVMGDGREFIGKQARDAGLADGFASLPGLLAVVEREPQSFAKKIKRPVPARPIGRAASALLSVPKPSPAAPSPPTRHEQALRAKRYAMENNIAFLDAFKALGFRL